MNFRIPPTLEDVVSLSWKTRLRRCWEIWARHYGLFFLLILFLDKVLDKAGSPGGGQVLTTIFIVSIFHVILWKEPTTPLSPEHMRTPDDVGRTQAQVEASCRELREVVPTSWTVVSSGVGPAANPTSYRVVALAPQGGLNIGCSADGRFVVHGLLSGTTVHPSSSHHRLGFETAQEAFDAMSLVVHQYQETMSQQLRSLQEHP